MLGVNPGAFKVIGIELPSSADAEHETFINLYNSWSGNCFYIISAYSIGTSLRYFIGYKLTNLWGAFCYFVYSDIPFKNYCSI